MSKLKTTTENLNLKSNNLRIRSYQFSLITIKFVSKFPEKRVFWIIGDQLLRASTSIGANIVEAKSSSSRREFIKFYEIALKSGNEVKYWLYLLKDSGLIESKNVESLIAEADEICKMLGSSLLTLKGKNKYT